MLTTGGGNSADLPRIVGEKTFSFPANHDPSVIFAALKEEVGAAFDPFD
ncbi:MAG: hypothetical protein OXE42_13160 [Gammaproteobacteria bacterium]|nr:hypothetical protein [Gammaproteobacteria bacterium]